MCEFSQKFKTFCLNLCATKFYPNLLASHLKILYKIKLYKNYLQTMVKMWVGFLGFYLVFNGVEFEFESNSNSNYIQTIMRSIFKTICKS
jgi:hypothetical protein